MNLAVTKTVKTKLPCSLYNLNQIKENILGKKYLLSIAFLDNKTAQIINKTYRGKNYTPDVLAFPLSKKSGEILITPAVTGVKAAARGESKRNYLIRLFIHGLLHLKGWRHGSKMDELEQKFYRKIAKNKQR
jgi:probable rRNA maturation factor